MHATLPLFLRSWIGSLAVAALVGLGTPGMAQQQPGQGPATTEPARADVAPLLTVLGFDDLMPILRDEGIAYAESIRADMFPDRTGAQWDMALQHIYDPDRMGRVMAQELARRLQQAQLAPVLAYFSSDLGQRIVLLEVTAREAMLAPSVEEAARQRAEEVQAAGGPRAGLLDSFVAANDLVEMNVAGALNANYAFYQGLASGGAFGDGLTEEEMLASVWEQEEAMRDETAAWIHAYVTLAYQPLSDADLQSYVDFSRTAEGRALNAALFGAFDALFIQISRDLGESAARMMSGQDI